MVLVLELLGHELREVNVHLVRVLGLEHVEAGLLLLAPPDGVRALRQPRDDGRVAGVAAGQPLPVVGQADADAPALVCVGDERVAEALAVRTLAHVLAARFVVVDRVQVAAAVVERLQVLQPLAVLPALLVPARAGSPRHIRPAGAGLHAAHLPRVRELGRLLVGVDVAEPRRQVVPVHVVVVAAEAAQHALVLGGGRYLQEAVAVPQQVDADVRRDADALLRALDVQHAVQLVRRVHARAVHLDAQLLPEVHLHRAHLQRHRLRPRGRLRVAAVVRGANGERVVLAVGRQLVLARTLEVEELSVERFVVGVAEHRARSGGCDSKGQNELVEMGKRPLEGNHSLSTHFEQHWFAAFSSVSFGRHLGVEHFSCAHLISPAWHRHERQGSRFHVSLLCQTKQFTIHPNALGHSVTYCVGLPLVRAGGAQLRNGRAMRAALARGGDLELGAALEHRTRVASTYRCTIHAGTRRAMVRVEAHAVVVEAPAHDALAGELRYHPLLGALRAALAGHLDLLRGRTL